MPLNYDFAIAETPGSDGLARFREPATAAALNAAPQAVQDFLAECGFGPGAYDSGAPQGAYWSTEESARLAIMERMSDTLERYRLPKPGEIPEGGFNLSHLFTAMMSAEPVERPREPPPRPVREPPPAVAEVPEAAEALSPGRVSAGLSAAMAPARPARPAQEGPSIADIRAALTAADLPPADTASAAPEPIARAATARPPRPAPGLELEMDFPAARNPGAATPSPAVPAPSPSPAPQTPSAATDSLSGAEESPAQGKSGAGRLVGVLMLVVGLALVLYAVFSLL
jgi:hypothetical protein